jgi:hypothetical protein
VVLDDEVEVDEVLVGGHGLVVVEMVLDDGLVDDGLVLSGPVTYETGSASGLSPSSSVSSGGSPPPSDGIAEA